MAQRCSSRSRGTHHWGS
ncbi:hypothetical protein LEMLEM_LOCUS1466 [Lemmus lemmus]